MTNSPMKTPDTVKKAIKEADTFGNLLSLEKLDRASPELWPEKIPGANDYIAMNSPIVQSPPAARWGKGFSMEDITAMQQLGSLSSTGLIAEIKKLYDHAYLLGIQESKEMTRGKYLNVFGGAKKK